MALPELPGLPGVRLFGDVNSQPARADSPEMRPLHSPAHDERRRSCSGVRNLRVILSFRLSTFQTIP